MINLVISILKLPAAGTKREYPIRHSEPGHHVHHALTTPSLLGRQLRPDRLLMLTLIAVLVSDFGNLTMLTGCGAII